MFLGTWRIVEMSTWSPKAFDMEGPAFIELGEDGSGRFRFLAVIGWLDCRYSVRSGDPCVEFSWEGHDDRAPASGRGWARVARGGDIVGEIFMHRGDDSTFRAVRTSEEMEPTRVSGAPRRSRRRR
jgi:hypothetical protein